MTGERGPHTRGLPSAIVKGRGSIMDIRMIAVDLDGTLLHDDKTVSAYTVDVLRRCQARGIAVTFATARAPRVALRFAGAINPDAASYYNGARLVDFDGTQTYNALTGAKAMESRSAGPSPW